MTILNRYFVPKSHSATAAGDLAWFVFDRNEPRGKGLDGKEVWFAVAQFSTRDEARAFAKEQNTNHLKQVA